MKIFAYGCSFTSYEWPSYADILGLQYNVINRGGSGSSNEKIFYFLMQDIKNNLISSEDIVITQWSGTNRFNYLKPNGIWIGEGNIALPQNKFILKKIKSWYNIDYEIEKSINIILSTRALLSQIGSTHLEMSLLPIDGIDSTFLENDLEGTYVGDYEFHNFPWKTIPNAIFKDSHPTILQHYDIAKRISKELSLELDIDENVLLKLHNKIHSETTFGKSFSF